MSDPALENPILPKPVSATGKTPPPKKQKTLPPPSKEAQEFSKKINSARKDSTKTFAELVQLACVERRMAYDMGCIEVADAETAYDPTVEPEYSIMTPMAIPPDRAKDLGEWANTAIKNDPDAPIPQTHKDWYVRPTRNTDPEEQNPKSPSNLETPSNPQDRLNPKSPSNLETPSNPQDGLNPDPKLTHQNKTTTTKKTKRKRKSFISPEFVATSFSESTSEPSNDEEPEKSSNIHRVFFLNENRRKALVAEVSRLAHDTGHIVFSDQNTPVEKLARTRLAERVKKALSSPLDSSTISDTSFDHTEILDLFARNPESFFHTLKLIKALKCKGYNDPTDIASRIIFSHDAGKNVICDPNPDFDNTIPPQYESLLESFDSRTPCQALTSSLLAVMNNDDNNSVSSPSFILEEPQNHSTPNKSKESTLSLKKSHLLTTSGGPIGSSNEQANPTDPHPSVQLALEIATKAAPFATLIQNFDDQKFSRVPISSLLQDAKDGDLKVPTPLDYHPHFKACPNILSSSFRGEPFPGVFLPSGASHLPLGIKGIEMAFEIFNSAQGRDPHTIVELNEFFANKYPSNLQYSQKRHCLDIPPYTFDFFKQGMRLDLDKLGVHPHLHPQHTPFNYGMKEIFINANDFLTPLAPYVANPLLTTLGPSPASRYKFQGWSVDLPDGSGSIVSHDVCFNKTTTTSGFFSKRTHIGRCAFCQGLHLLPVHVIILGYFWPKDFTPDLITSEIRLYWSLQKVPICWIHYVSNGYYKKERDITLASSPITTP